MKKVTVIIMILSVGFMYAQNNDKVKYEQKGDLVEATIYHDNGEIEQHGFFKEKKLHGTWTYFNEQGKKIAIGKYRQGIKTGKWLVWDNDAVKEVNYLNGKIVKVTELTGDSMVLN